MPSRKPRVWRFLVLVPIVLLCLIPALWMFVSFTATPIHRHQEALPAVSQSSPAPQWAAATARARQIAHSGLVTQNLPGLSVAVGIDGEVVWAEGFGFADVRYSVPVTPDHRFRIGTASTVLTSAAAGLLLENGALRLEDPIQKYVPAFRKKQWPVTLRELMAHTGGISSDGKNGPQRFSRHCTEPAGALPEFAEHPLQFQPGTQYRYSSYGWILVSAAVEAAGGQPFLTFLQDRVFHPLNMRHTAADPGPDPAELEGEDFPLFILMREMIHDPSATRLATAEPTRKLRGDQVTPYFPRFQRDPNYGFHVGRLVDYSCYAGASVFVSTPSDLVRFGMAVNSGKLLKPATVDLLQRSQRLTSGEETGYGLGWRATTVPIRGKPTHASGTDGNSMGGMVASLITLPEYGIAAAVTSNIPFADTSTLTTEIAQAFAEQKR